MEQLTLEFPAIVSEIEVSYKPALKQAERVQVNNSQKVYQYLRQHWNNNTISLFEEFKILLVDTKYRAFAIYSVSAGSATGTVVDVRRIFAAALKANAAGLILCHNHPSGTLRPSRADFYG